MKTPMAQCGCLLLVAGLAACHGGELDASPRADNARKQLDDATGGSGGSAGAGGTGGSSGASGTGGTGGTAGSGGSSGASAGTAGTGGPAGSSGSGGIAGTGGSAGSVSCPPSGGAAGSGGITGVSPSGCGDAHRDTTTEECDDGNSSDTDACTTTCTVVDQLAVAPATSPTLPPPAGRRLGEGRHPAAASAHGAIVAFVDELSFAVGISTFDTVGTRTATVPAVSAGLQASNPVVTRAPCDDGYLLAWTDFNGDSDELGIAIGHLGTTGAMVGAVQHASGATGLSQRDPDLITTAGNQTVVAWVDDSDPDTAPDIRYSVLSPSLVPGAQQTLAATGDAEANIALAEFAGSWVASWRAGQGATENIVVKSMGAVSTTWTLGPLTPGPADDRPALVELDATHLYAFYSEGADTDGSGVPNGSILHGAVLSTGDGSVTACEPLAMDVVDVSHPAAVQVGARNYLAWRTAAVLGSPDGEDVWIAPLAWTTGDSCPTLGAPVAIPRQDMHLAGDQRHPALAASPLGPEGAIVAAWEDLGGSFTGEGNADVVVELISAPIVRLGGM